MGPRTAVFRAFALLTIACAGSSVGTAIAEADVTHGPRRVPSEVIIYLHPEIKDRDFVDPLVCALEKILIAPVSTKDLPLSLGPELNSTRTQLDPHKVVGRFLHATAADGDGSTFKHLIVSRDMTTRPYNFLFAASFGTNGETNPLQIISTARLASQYSKPPTAVEIALTVQRLYKVIIRSIVQNTGNAHLNGCVMAFPNSIAEHDQKSADFCASDRMRLVRQGVLRKHNIDGCQAVAQRQRPDLVTFVISQ